MNPLIQFKQTASVFLVALLLACFAILQNAQAVVPAPNGGYPGGNTAEGQAALLSPTSGTFYTAIRAGTLLANTADGNTATGAEALLSNTLGINNTPIGSQAF